MKDTKGGNAFIETDDVSAVRSDKKIGKGFHRALFQRIYGEVIKPDYTKLFSYSLTKRYAVRA